MLDARARDGVRRRLRLLLAVAAIAFSLLAMHQLSGDHTAAEPGFTSSERAGVGLGGPTVGHTHHRAHHPAERNHGHADKSAGRNDDRRSPHGDCPGCAGHQAMLATCLAALSLLTVGGCLVRPRAWRGVRIPRLQLRRAGIPAPWTRRSLSLAELSISRT